MYYYIPQPTAMAPQQVNNGVPQQQLMQPMMSQHMLSQPMYVMDPTFTQQSHSTSGQTFFVNATDNGIWSSQAPHVPQQSLQQQQYVILPTVANSTNANVAAMPNVMLGSNGTGFAVMTAPQFQQKAPEIPQIMLPIMPPEGALQFQPTLHQQQSHHQTLQAFPQSVFVKKPQRSAPPPPPPIMPQSTVSGINSPFHHPTLPQEDLQQYLREGAGSDGTHHAQGYIEVFDPEFRYVSEVPVSSVTHVPAARLKITRLVFCKNYSAGNATCNMGPNCKFVHSDVDMSKLHSHSVHVKYSWPTADACTYPRLAAGRTLSVLLPGNKHPAEEIPSDQMLVTRGGNRALNATQAELAATPLAHCPYYHFNRLCHRGEWCHFIHAVHVDPNSVGFKRAPRGHRVTKTSDIKSPPASVSPKDALRSPLEFPEKERSTVPTPVGGQLLPMVLEGAILSTCLSHENSDGVLASVGNDNSLSSDDDALPKAGERQVGVPQLEESRRHSDDEELA